MRLMINYQARRIGSSDSCDRLRNHVSEYCFTADLKESPERSFVSGTCKTTMAALRTLE